ncbi:hypothetical protein N431DRAFT_472553 [Stipitochalara longipes BDJ]|nr:hypothetical protein N431DRAFT_472553 [Stipitochalara longipes BDJ]
MSPFLLERVHAIVEGDATDAAALEHAIRDHDIEGIIDVAGNVTPPWKDFLLPKISSAVGDAAVAVRKQRGKLSRAWITSVYGILKYLGTDYLFQDYMPRFASNQHQATRDVVEAIPIQDLKWLLLAVAQMSPANRKQGLFEPLDAPQYHDLLLEATSSPGWEKTWLSSIPLIGLFLHAVYCGLVPFRTKYEDVADFLAEDLEKGDSQWIGRKVGMKEKSRKDV